jgi:hypothetical protein
MIPDTHVHFGPGLGNADPLYPALDGPQAIALMDHAGYFPTCQPALSVPLVKAFP